MKRTAMYILALLAATGVTMLSVSRCKAINESQASDTLGIDTMPMMLLKLQQCSRLNVVEMKVHKIVTHDDPTQIGARFMGKDLTVTLPTGKRKVAIPLYATVKASIDMSQITSDQVKRDGDRIEVFLPKPDVRITETHVDHDGIRQYVDIMRSNFTDEELQAYQKRGREAIEKELPQMKLEEKARLSAARQIVPIIKALGFDESNITITFITDETHNATITRQDR